MLTPRLLLVTFASALVGGCLTGGQASDPQQRDERLFSELQRQGKWAGEAVAGRASADELKQAAAGDQDAQAELRTRFITLVRAADRATWVREATPAALPQTDAPGQAALIAAFDRAGQLRQQAWDAADQIGTALASTSGPSALSLDDLRRALLTVHAATVAEAKLAHLAPAATALRPGSGKGAQAKQAAAPLQLKPTPAPMPEPFIESAAVLIDKHPAEEDGLKSFDPGLAPARKKIRASLQDLRARHPPEEEQSAVGESSASGSDTGPSTAAETAAAARRADQTPPPEASSSGPPPPPGWISATAPAAESRLDLATGDARRTLDKRGLPQAILLRPDGNFVFHYGAGGRCAATPCRSPGDLIFTPDGKRVAPDAKNAAPDAPVK